MLRQTRDAAGDSGEFYTPRAVVRLVVAVTDPRLGETVLDPACGTGGFLVEAFNHLPKQVKTVADRKVLQEKSPAIHHAEAATANRALLSRRKCQPYEYQGLRLASEILDSED